ncbi:RrF2 family transcriptional regulator [Flavihumibacter sp. UBA7668]|uniref:RrF2 family transcriptional regulator n=1 Tax=Flavihumibacter sp. UBA7668 TaxID=1946542 RepID=UPI0025B9B0FC|nr:Rrf2 family transcriptional regulator [Flavihumibacter sp. UBA7668]
MLSITCKTGIRAAIFLASRINAGEKYNIQEIAAVVDGNEHTLGKLLQTLVKANVISSAKGPSGGFFITEEQVLQPLLYIVLALDGDELFHACGLGLSQCSATKPCPLHAAYAQVRDQLELLFRNTSILDISKDVSKGAAFLS